VAAGRIIQPGGAHVDRLALRGLTRSVSHNVRPEKVVNSAMEEAE